ncbi:hypothetical protein FisN_2Lh282 [Fistulifera solaris]|uniref:Uncharacterized protein n=1 Tax=Fistulifera solaris TaxID=1519565 RepID=A0A1Z5KFG9_FISSO|nr:hypothetical protein FisN_2Lh282 [Fistulifera solaris]|eukprot:GAX24999.1 hypothetical protein FisN_2Lh282 [Fistulifera solaris]
MGACCSCCEDASAVVSETEMKEQKATNEKSLSISRVMSAPSVDVQDDCKMSGYGLGLVGVAVEQDAAYWEAHIYHDPGMSQEVSFGVATKKDQQFYRAMEEQDSADAKGTSLMRSIKVKNGDVVGIAVQQSDLPMNIDDLALDLAARGYLNSTLEDVVKRVEDAKLPKKEHALWIAMNSVFFHLTVRVLIPVWAVFMFVADAFD